MKMKKLIKIAAIPGILLVGLLAMQALGSTRKESQKRELTPEPRAVETQRLSFGELTLAVEGNGVVESERVLNIVSEAAGRVVYAKNDLKDGTFVREGEVVVRIDARDVENDLYALRSDFLNAVASVLPELQLDAGDIYKRWFDYFNSLDIDRPVPELPEITNAQEKIKVSTKDIIGKYYGVKNQEIRLSKYTIRAPFGGYIGSGSVIKDAFVTQGQPLFSLSDAENLVVAVPLLVDQIGSIDFAPAPGVTIYSEESGELTRSGRVTRKQTKVDRNSQTLNVYVTFKNRDLSPHFLPGNYVHVQIAGRTLRDVAAIPRHLLDAENHVFTMEEEKLNRVKLDVAALQGDYAIIKRSIPEETVLVTTILQRPLIGMSIRSTNTLEPLLPSDLADADGRTDTAAGG